jgi:precorrin-6A/cobalt-precorrin-6A reductase
MPPHLLILGGTTESRLLAEQLSTRTDLRVTLSLAGRTQAPRVHGMITRSGGFGGVEGLMRYLKGERVACLVDATHPFATQISEHARIAAERTATKLIALHRPPWVRQAGDQWTEVANTADAVDALGARSLRVFITIGRQGLAELRRAPQHHYWIRTVDPVEPPLPLPHVRYIVARGPFAQPAEEATLRTHAIETLVAKNSGGPATYGKIAAARKLSLPVILIRRAAQAGPVLAVESVEAAARHALEALALDIERGV